MRFASDEDMLIEVVQEERGERMRSRSGEMQPRKKKRIITRLAAVSQKKFVEEHGLMSRGRRWFEIDQWEEIMGREVWCGGNIYRRDGRIPAGYKKPGRGNWKNTPRRVYWKLVQELRRSMMRSGDAHHYTSDGSILTKATI